MYLISISEQSNEGNVQEDFISFAGESPDPIYEIIAFTLNFFRKDSQHFGMLMNR